MTTPLDKMRDALDACRIQRWEKVANGVTRIVIGTPFGGWVEGMEAAAEEGFAKAASPAGALVNEGYVMWAEFVFDAAGNCTEYLVLE